MELNLFKLLLAIACCDLSKKYRGIVLTVMGGYGESLVWEEPNGGYGLKIGGMKPSGSHGMLTY